MSTGRCGNVRTSQYSFMKETYDQQAKSADSEVGGKITRKYKVIKISFDWHAREYRASRMVDDGGPEPARRLSSGEALRWVKKQVAMAEKVYTCYEAGAGGFTLHRQLTALGAENLVVAPRKLDPNHRGVQTDCTDARDLVLDLDRYVRGNPEALRPVWVPTPEQEQRRTQSRQRRRLQSDRLRLAARGRSLLLSQGILESNNWWRMARWTALRAKLPGWLVEALEIYLRLILKLEEEIQALLQKIKKAARGVLPKGMGALTSEELEREILDWNRFKNRKQPGGYSGLVGGVASSGKWSIDLPITKAGSARLRAILVEMAWRWVAYQPQSRLVQRWRSTLLTEGAHPRARKRAIVALARGLIVDLWRWKTGRASPEQLGWIMLESSAK